MKALATNCKPKQTVAIVALEDPPSTYDYLRGTGTRCSVLDCWTNPYGWDLIKSNSATHEGPHLALFTEPDGPKALHERIVAAMQVGNTSASRMHVYLDGLSSLMDVFGVQSTCIFLSKLRADACIASVCFRLHSDLHSEQEIRALCHGATCTMSLRPCIDSSENSTLVDAYFQIRRRNGLPKTEKLRFRLDGDGLECSLVTNFQGAGASITSNPSARQAKGAELSRSMAGGMRLEVSETEASARRDVQLPYEHQGKGTLYSSPDYRDYLPEAAGGNAPRLGHILYVRESDSEEPDSDEDPDDDLDI